MFVIFLRFFFYFGRIDHFLVKAKLTCLSVLIKSLHLASELSFNLYFVSSTDLNTVRVAWSSDRQSFVSFRFDFCNSATSRRILSSPKISSLGKRFNNWKIILNKFSILGDFDELLLFWTPGSNFLWLKGYFFGKSVVKMLIEHPIGLIPLQ